MAFYVSGAVVKTFFQESEYMHTKMTTKALADENEIFFLDSEKHKSLNENF